MCTFIAVILLLEDLNVGSLRGAALALSSVFTNDLPLVLTMYADDCTLHKSADSIKELNDMLQSDLESVSDWVDKNKLVLNVSKTESILFGSKHALQNELPLALSVKGMALEQVHEAKLLGVKLDEQLTWLSHINKLVATTGGDVAVIRRCAYFLTDHSVKQVIKSFVLSQLD